MAYKDFVNQTFHFRKQVTKTTAYTATLDDEAINVNGTSVTITLPLISTMQGSTTHEKVFKISNTGTATVATIAPVTASGNTIGGRNAWTVMPNETVVIRAQEVDTDWSLVSPYPQPGLKNNPFAKAVVMSGTTTVHVFDSSGAPNNLFITGGLVIAGSTTASTVTVLTGTDVCFAVTKGTGAAGTVYGSTAITTPVVAKGAAFSLSGAVAEATTVTVIIFGEEQTYS